MCPSVPLSVRAMEARMPPSSVHAAMRLGKFRVFALSDGDFDLAAVQLLIEERPGRVSELLERAQLPPVVRSSVNAFLIDTGEARVLVDAGAGELQGPGLGRLEASLRKAGHAPEDIDAVLLTHLHPDHVGGIARAGRRVFPAAEVWVDARELVFWCDGTRSAQVDASVRASFDGAMASLRPYESAGVLRSFRPDEQPVRGLRTMGLEGHTAGHTGFMVESEGERLIVCGDVLHVAALQLAEPRLAIRYDSEPALASDAREHLLATAAGRGDWLAAAHAPFPGIGKVRRDGPGYAWLPLAQATAA
ncbi:MBL fold metallo-hydrolase [Dyella marensis]|uniref:MBL fold metallo-hydrolase n=1 Tax=Dyella marensis TaxID=500610 RepID=UPI0031E07A4E